MHSLSTVQDACWEPLAEVRAGGRRREAGTEGEGMSPRLSGSALRACSTGQGGVGWRNRNSTVDEVCGCERAETSTRGVSRFANTH